MCIDRPDLDWLLHVSILVSVSMSKLTTEGDYCTAHTASKMLDPKELLSTNFCIPASTPDAHEGTWTQIDHRGSRECCSVRVNWEIPSMSVGDPKSEIFHCSEEVHMLSKLLLAPKHFTICVICSLHLTVLIASAVVRAAACRKHCPPPLFAAYT